MAVLKCTVCGGELDVNADLSVGVCKFCDSIITIPKELDRKGNLYNRAIFLRQNNEFDKAVGTYEDILKEDNSDAEAHWGLVLSKFGIEYVLDPKSQERIPTCHRTQAQSILSDPDYLAAIDNADIESKRVFENEAKRINEIQTRILEISQKEEPYDIFICYKETDEMGNRTENSTLAQDLYYELNKKGYRVFFARKSLESKLGAEYEPIIFAALNSAKVMIVLGTKAEHFNAVWVRNEWSRFIHLSKDTHKTIIPAYREISPYELPAELSTLQSQDMSKIGFMQDLTDGIERCMRGETTHKAAQQEVTQTFGTTSLERLLQNSTTYLKLSNYICAEEVYTTVTKEYPEDYRGWWGLIICKTKNFSDIILDQTELNEWFRYVKQLSSPTDFSELENQYVEYTKMVSQLAATEDMKTVNLTINKYGSEIQKKNNCIQTLQSRIEGIENAWRQEDETYRSEINSCENTLSETESKRSRKTAGLTFGGIALTIGVIVLLTGGRGILWGLLIGGVGFLFLNLNSGNNGSGEPTFKELDNRDSKMREAISTAKKAQDDKKKERDRNIASVQKSISDVKAEISVLNKNIVNCRKYLELGKDKISERWFSKRCDAFGVKKSFDNNIEVMRKAALGIVEKAIDDTVSINCPACGEEIRESRNVLATNGCVICKTCGNTIEVNVSSQSTNETTIDDMASDAFYGITCPSCNQEFSINKETLDSGYCSCPNCEMKIEFEDAQ